MRGRNNFFFRDSHRIQTCNLLIRSQMLYSVELANRFLRVCKCKVIAFFWNDQIFFSFFTQNFQRSHKMTNFVEEIDNT